MRTRNFGNINVSGNIFIGGSGGATGTPGFYVGNGAPSFTAGKGSLYLRMDGSSTSTRAYINTDGATTWTAVTTAA